MILVDRYLSKSFIKFNIFREMTKREFLIAVPGMITHKTWGEGEIEIVADTNDKKGVCYRHHNNTASFGTYGSNWFELYGKFVDRLIDQGYMNSKIN